MTNIDPAYAANVLHQVLTSLKGGDNPNASNLAAPADTTALGATPKPATTGVRGGGEGAGTYSGGGEIGSRDQDNFYTALLTKLGMPVNDQNLRFMRAWNQGEGMDAGYYNPFATTQGYANSRDLNSVGVKAYSSLEDGVNATAQTLLNGQYAGILAGLAASDPIQAAQGVANSPWGTGALVLQILGG